MAHSQTYDGNYEDTPSNGDVLSSAPLMFAGFTEGIRERIASEHEMTVGSNNIIHGRHKQGSFAGFYQSACPLLTADGEELTDSDIGMIWVNENTKIGYVWAGTDDDKGWQPLSRSHTGIGANSGWFQTSWQRANTHTRDQLLGILLAAPALVSGLNPAFGYVSPTSDPADAGLMYAANRSGSNIDIYYYQGSTFNTISLTPGSSDPVIAIGGLGIGE